MAHYIRFVVAGTKLWSGRESGLVQQAYALRDNADIENSDREILSISLRWLDDHLPVPTRFNRSSSKGHYRRETRGLGWFKDSAQPHITHMRALMDVALRYGMAVRELTTERPGYIVFEDDVQVVAEPFNDTMS